jgi:hypothetical protein
MDIIGVIHSAVYIHTYILLCECNLHIYGCQAQGRKFNSYVQAKWIAVTGQASAKAPAEDGGLPDRRLSDYLALPVSEYSLLDPKWVER